MYVHNKKNLNPKIIKINHDYAAEYENYKNTSSCFHTKWMKINVVIIYNVPEN